MAPHKLLAAGETVLDVPPALSARVRLLDSGRKDKTDVYDARSAAIVALRHPNLRPVIRDDHRGVLRLLARRHHQLVAGRTRSICRLHALLAVMIEGGLPPKLTAKRAYAPQIHCAAMACRRSSNRSTCVIRLKVWPSWTS